MALILDFTILRQQIITDANLFAVAHFKQIQILSSAECRTHQGKQRNK